MGHNQRSLDNAWHSKLTIAITALLVFSSILITISGFTSYVESANGSGDPPLFVSHGGSVDPTNPMIPLKDQIILKWASSGGNRQWMSFDIQISEYDDFNQLLVDTNVAKAEYVFTLIEHNTTYFWRVKEYYQGGVTSFSASFEFTIRFPPIISWTGEKGFIGDGIHPEEGLVGEGYNFRISYRDEYTGLAPDFIKLVLDVPGDRETEIDLAPLSNHDDYSHGVIHAVYMNLTKAGSYRYFFKAGYGDDLGTVRMPTSEGVYMSDLLVNTAPRIYGGIDQTYGVESTTFRYNATFWDADNDPADPKNSFIYVDGVHHPMIETNIYDLDTVDGKGYYYELSSLKQGVHDFYFYFKDSFGTITKTTTSFHPIIYEGWPDLKVASSDISFRKDPETEKLVIEANIHNIGKGSATGIPVTFWSDDPDNQDEHFEPLPDMNDNYSYIIPYLAKGRSHFIEWVTWIKYDEIQKGSYYVIVDLDYTGNEDPYSPLAKARQVKEGIQEVIDYSTDNTNNKAGNIFLYGPNVELRKSEVTPQSLIYSSSGKEVTFRVKVRNVGNEEVPWDRDIVIKFGLTSPDGKDEINMGSYVVKAGMAAGSYEYAKKSYRFSGPEGEIVGKWVLMIEAEVTGGGPGGIFSEPDTGNNVVYIDLDIIKIQPTTLALSFSPSIMSVVSGLLVLVFAITWPQRRKKVH